MFLKIIGTGLLMISSSGYGFYLKNRYRKRLLGIEEVCQYLEELKGEIKYRNQDFFRVFLELEKNRRTPFLGQVICKELKSGKSISEAWCISVKENADRMALKGHEKMILLELGNQLGKSNSETQTNLLILYQNKLHMLWKGLKKEEQNQCKMYSTLGILGGVMIGLIVV
ncbi:MAG: stage III sporulation protein AB [Eubacterium sp.]|nr:stage III sporulation protein AB [Eubacterium sp.]